MCLCEHAGVRRACVGAKVLVSEKTLEVNIASEVLTTVRQIPGCNGTFWIGMKQL